MKRKQELDFFDDDVNSIEENPKIQDICFIDKDEKINRKKESPKSSARIITNSLYQPKSVENIETPDYDKLPNVMFPMNSKYEVTEHIVDLIKLYRQSIIHSSKKFVKHNSFSKKVDQFPVIERPVSWVERQIITWHMQVDQENPNPLWTPKTLSKIIAMHLRSKDTVVFSTLEWFVTNYAKEFGTTVDIDGKEFKIHEEYEKYSRPLTKQLCDFFGRKPKIVVEINDVNEDIYSYLNAEEYKFLLNDDSKRIYWLKDFSVGFRVIGNHKLVYLVTSVAQLNGFKWCLSSKILETCKKYEKEVIAHKKYKKSQIKPENGKRRKLSTTKTKKSTFVVA